MPDGPAAASPSPPAPPRPDGLVLAPFRALRYDPTRSDLTTVTSPPYDVLDAAGVAALEEASDVNVVRLILPRDGAAEGDRYERAAATLRAWRATGVLQVDEAPALYVYEQASDTHAQRGLVGALALSPAEDGVVLPHENTMSDTVSDRLALYTAVEADLEPIFLVYAGGGAASAAVGQVDDRVPLVDVTLADGLRHRLWALTDPAELEAVAADLRPRTALIADGHHRYATYLQRQAAAHARGAGPGPWDAGLVLLVDTTRFGPEVHPIHRVIPGIAATELAGRSAEHAKVEELDGAGLKAGLEALRAAGAQGPAYLLADGAGAVLRLLTEPSRDGLRNALPPERSAAWRELDVTVLHHFLVPVAWGLTDDVESVGFEHDVSAALAAAARTDGTAVLLNPTASDVVAAVAAQGERMPRKSTLFTPKPRTGMVIRDHLVD
ncbi:MAG TPA: DUF1015 domain-containing protein [Mycobacteriales bacterium]|nr:DUF1015 domain-containing protein [Mycobacteriales bacterium]